MGLFGNKGLKRLSRTIEAGWMSLRLPTSVGSLSAEERLQRIGQDIMDRAQPLVAAGRLDEARAAIEAARKPGDTPHEQVWNRLLAAVVQQL